MKLFHCSIGIHYSYLFQVKVTWKEGTEQRKGLEVGAQNVVYHYKTYGSVRLFLPSHIYLEDDFCNVC
jgi:hypothetical protein